MSKTANHLSSTIRQKKKKISTRCTRNAAFSLLISVHGARCPLLHVRHRPAKCVQQRVVYGIARHGLTEVALSRWSAVGSETAWGPRVGCGAQD
eukprot:1831413-Rhodomonas_salina.3